MCIRVCIYICFNTLLIYNGDGHFAAQRLRLRMDEVYGDIVHIEKEEGLEPGEGLATPPDVQADPQNATEQTRLYHPPQTAFSVSEENQNVQNVSRHNDQDALKGRNEDDSSENKGGADMDEDARSLVPAVRGDYRLLRRNRELQQLRMCFGSCKLALYIAWRVLSIVDGKGDVLK
jgi:hypothetical protein